MIPSKVSVVMAVYNGEKYVRSAVDSILGQTRKDFEFIIVNDGSTDSTSEILGSLRDTRLIYLENRENQGLSRSLNIGISIAQGNYIARQDADDISQADRLNLQVEYLDRHPEIGVLGTSAKWIDNEGNPLGTIWPPGADNAQLQQLLIYTCPLIHGSTMYRRECFEEVGGYDAGMRTGQDYDFWLRISESWDLACLPDVLYSYRWHENMASVTQKMDQISNSDESLARSLRRRLSYAKSLLGINDEVVPARLNYLSRPLLAQRYAWWSSGARWVSKKLAFKFLIISMVLYPASPDIWMFVREVISNKVSNISRSPSFNLAKKK